LEKKLDTQKLNFNRLIEDRYKREEQMKKAINALDKKCIAIEKRLLESGSGPLGGMPAGLIPI
jgi:hypothetical protein